MFNTLAANLGSTAAKKVEGFSLEVIMWLMLLLGAVLWSEGL